MKDSEMQYVIDIVGEEEILDKIGWSNGKNLFKIDPKMPYEEAEKLIDQNPDRAFLFSLSNVPFERREHIQLAGLSQRLDTQYYLKNTTGTKNIAFLGASQTAYYSDPLVGLYLKEINSQVALKQVDVADLDKFPVAINSGTQWSNESLQRLHPQEWTPRPASGIFTVICHKENFSLRKQIAKLHFSESQVLGNIERRVEQLISAKSGILLLGTYCFINAQHNYQIYLVIDRGNGLEHLSTSQSTSHGLEEALMAKLI